MNKRLKIIEIAVLDDEYKMLLERKTRTDITRKRDYQIREQHIKTESKSFNDDLSRLENTTRKLAEQVNTIKMQQKQQKTRRTINKKSVFNVYVVKNQISALLFYCLISFSIEIFLV